jgi:hypothetical protein
MLQSTWVCRCLCCNLTHILSGIFLRVELLDHMEALFLVFWGSSILFSKVVVLREFASWVMGLLRQLAESNVILCQHRLSGLMSKGWAPRTKGSHLIYLCKQVRSKKQGLIHIWLYLILLATLPYCYVTFPSLVLCDPLHVQISQVLSLWYAILSSLLLSQDSSLVCFLLIHLPATVVLIYVPTNSVWGFLFPHILTNIGCCLCSWWYSF